MENNDQAKWINTVLNEMGSLDSPEVKKAMENCGRKCLKSSDGFAAIQALRDTVEDKDNVELLFETYKREIYENRPTLYKMDGDIYLEYNDCYCGMVTTGGINNPFLCNCTVGYTKQIFETLFGKPVIVTLLKSILNGDDICQQKISLAVA